MLWIIKLATVGCKKLREFHSGAAIAQFMKEDLTKSPYSFDILIENLHLCY